MATIRRVNSIKVQIEASARALRRWSYVWIQQNLNINTDQVDMLQLNMQEKSLYIKVISPTVYEKIVQKHEGETKFKYGNGEQTQIKISKADSPAITVRVFNLPPECRTQWTIDIKRRANDDTARGARRTGGRHTDTSSETAEITNVVTDRTEQPTLETTDRTEDTTAEEVNTDVRNAAPELMETTVIPPESKSPSQFGNAPLEPSRFSIRWQNDIDVLLLQEVNNDNFEFLGPQYEYVVNTGTAIIYRAGMDIDQVETHPSGRVISMNLNNTQVINVYLPSGTNYRQERILFAKKSHSTCVTDTIGYL
ncbi:hypothetical protein ANN_19252 [Periplaneta americana]|uniref:Uncharacterized protein n=1 Tax=Periplaneta americana TaxID=6978 RepID=A0ABQ8S9D0_PERAM|nr:hypothetical protein ANN_19252 [Periplaneta americana]